jgi:CheY-like chemotaxis protein
MGNSLQRDILIVSATPLIRELLHDVFLTAHYTCLLAADGGEAIEKFRRSRPSLVVTDFNLPDMCGSELLQEVRQDDLDVAVIMLCGSVFKHRGKVIGFLDVDAVRSASLELGAYAVLEKPVDVEELLLTADRAHRVAAERHAIR